MGVLEDVKKLVVEQVGLCDESEAKVDSKLAEDLGFDSLDEVELIMYVEEKFDIQISDEDASGLITIGDVVNFVEKSIGE